MTKCEADRLWLLEILPRDLREQTQRKKTAAPGWVRL